MTLLALGMLQFLAAHSFPMLPARRAALIAQLGEEKYKGLYALVSLVGLVLIVLGMRSVEFVPVYQPPSWAHPVTSLLMLAGIFCFGAFGSSTNLKRYTAHPMLWGVTLWALGHLLANGDLASLILFGGFGAYALMDMFSANRRGAKPLGEKVSWKEDAKLLVISVIVYALLVFGHKWYAGMPLIG